MSLTLHVDLPRWREHAAATVGAFPGVVPVIKGNGYGLGTRMLLAECRRLVDAGSVTAVAVGTYHEAPAALEALAGLDVEVLVLEPFRRQLHAGLSGHGAPALVHTVTDAEDLRALVGLSPQGSGPRILAEGLTTMNRHGAPAGALADLIAAAPERIGGVTLHLPLGTGHIGEVSTWLDRFPQVRSWFVSHLAATELATLRAAYPHLTVRPRVGTALWLGAPQALDVRADVLDVRAVAAGEPAGYRGRRMPAGHLLVVSGGTAHGVALAAPSSVATMRQRVIALAEGVGEAAGRVRSPFVHAGRHLWFVEPPHMQVSLVHVPSGVAPPSVGDALSARVRLTTTWVDKVATS